MYVYGIDIYTHTHTHTHIHYCCTVVNCCCFCCCCSAVFQSDSLTLESVNGSLKVVYFTPNTSGVSVCVLCVVCESGEEGG